MDKDIIKIRIISVPITIVIAMFVPFWLTVNNISPFLQFVFYGIFIILISLNLWVIDRIMYRKFYKKLRALKPIILDEHNVDNYITKVNTLLKGKKVSPLSKYNLKHNLSVAYCRKREFSKAKELLMQINPINLSIIYRTTYWANLAYVHFYLHEDKQAILILKNQKSVFSKNINNPDWKRLIAILLIFQMIAEGNQLGARQLLEQERLKWKREIPNDDFEYLDKLC